MNYVYKRDDAANTAAIVQFRQNAVPDTTLNLNKGTKIDLIKVLIQGLDQVDFGKKSMTTCLQKPQVGVMKDTTSAGGLVDWSKCISYSKDMGRWGTIEG